MIICPFLLVITLGAFYQRYGELVAVRNAVSGMAAVAAGLICATAIKIAIAMYQIKGRAEERAIPPRLGLLAFTSWGRLGWRLIWVFGPLAAVRTFYFYRTGEKNAS